MFTRLAGKADRVLSEREEKQWLSKNGTAESGTPNQRHWTLVALLLCLERRASQALCLAQGEGAPPWATRTPLAVNATRAMVPAASGARIALTVMHRNATRVKRLADDTQFVTALRPVELPNGIALSRPGPGSLPAQRTGLLARRH